MPKTPFDPIAHYYDMLHTEKDYGAECRFLERVMQRFLGAAPKELLDVGCGTGSHALALAKRGYAVTAVDHSAGMLERARKKSGRNHPRLHLVLADLGRLSLRVQFDAAYSVDGPVVSLATRRELLQHFRAIRKHLRPGGIYMFDFTRATVPRGRSRGWILHKVPPYEIVELYEVTPGPGRGGSTIKDQIVVTRGSRVVDRISVTLHQNALSVPTLRALLKDAGFSTVSFHSTGGGPFTLGRLREDDEYPLAVATR